MTIFLSEEKCDWIPFSPPGSPGTYPKLPAHSQHAFREKLKSKLPIQGVGLDRSHTKLGKKERDTLGVWPSEKLDLGIVTDGTHVPDLGRKAVQAVGMRLFTVQ